MVQPPVLAIWSNSQLPQLGKGLSSSIRLECRWNRPSTLGLLLSSPSGCSAWRGDSTMFCAVLSWGSGRRSKLKPAGRSFWKSERGNRLETILKDFVESDHTLKSTWAIWWVCLSREISHWHFHVYLPSSLRRLLENSCMCSQSRCLWFSVFSTHSDWWNVLSVQVSVRSRCAGVRWVIVRFLHVSINGVMQFCLSDKSAHTLNFSPGALSQCVFHLGASDLSEIRVVQPFSLILRWF